MRFGKYEVVRQIGEGGFGRVYEGWDPDIRRRVAIKTCLADYPEVRARFLREASIAGNLAHRNITVVFDLGEEDGVPFLVQEYLAGADLDQLIEKRHPSIGTLAQRVALLAQLARGLGYAHSQGVIHRDIKPSNLRILDDGLLKIMDFGIAKSNRGDTSLTATGETVGTSTYLAPEQVRGDELDGGCDIYAFGAIAFELLSYRPLYAPSSPQRLVYQIVKEPAPDLAKLCPELPPRLCAVVRRCLQKERPHRYANCSELLMELNQLDSATLAAVDAKSAADSASSRSAPVEKEADATPSASASTASEDSAQTNEVEPLPVRSARRQAATRSSEGAISRRDRSNSAPPPASGTEADDERAGSRYRDDESDEFDTAEVEPLLSAVREARGSGVDGSLDLGSVTSSTPTLTSREASGRRRSAALVVVLLLVAVSALVVWFRLENDEVADSGTTISAEAPAAREFPSEAARAASSPATGAQQASLRILPGWDPEIRVSIDGRNAETLSEEILRALPPGRHVLEFSVLLDDYQAFENLVVDLEAGQRLVIEPPLAEPGRLTFRAPPTSPELFVRLNGSPLGWSPVEARRVAPGEHRVQIAASPTSEERQLTIRVDSASETTVVAGLDERLEVVVRQQPLAR